MKCTILHESRGRMRVHVNAVRRPCTVQMFWKHT